MKWIAWILTLLLAFGALAAQADEQPLQAVTCPRQGFATVCEAGLRWQWDDVNGLVIHTGRTGGAPCMMICVTDGAGTDFEGYFNDTLTPRLQRALGDRLMAVSPLDSYALADGASLPGVMYTWLDDDGRRQVLFRLFDTRWDRNVCYTLRYPEGDADDTLRALGIAVKGFRMEGEAPADGQPAGQWTVACPQQGFTAVCDVPCVCRWSRADGLYVYLGEWGEPPYVLIRAGSGKLDIPAFFSDAVTPAMRQRYGDDLLEEIDCGNITIGQRVMTGFGYRYRLGEGVIYMLRVLENRDGGNVSYIMKYPEGDEAARATAMAALTSIADSFGRDGD